MSKVAKYDKMKKMYAKRMKQKKGMDLCVKQFPDCPEKANPEDCRICPFKRTGLYNKECE